MSLLDAFKPVEARTLPVILLLDTSGSMREDDKIEVLNDSVTEMIEELVDVDAGHGFITMTIVTFGGDSARVIASNQPVAEIEFSFLRASGRTPLGQAFRLARTLIEDREAMPSRGYSPTLALVSDGIPTDENWDDELDALLTSERAQKATRFALAVGADADRQLLGRFAGGKPHEAEEAAQIRKFLRFVTMTVTQVTLSAFEPDVAAEPDSSDSIARLQRHDAF